MIKASLILSFFLLFNSIHTNAHNVESFSFPGEPIYLPRGSHFNIDSYSKGCKCYRLSIMKVNSDSKYNVDDYLSSTNMVSPVELSGKTNEKIDIKNLDKKPESIINKKMTSKERIFFLANFEIEDRVDHYVNYKAQNNYEEAYGQFAPQNSVITFIQYHKESNVLEFSVETDPRNFFADRKTLIKAQIKEIKVGAQVLTEKSFSTSKKLRSFVSSPDDEEPRRFQVTSKNGIHSISGSRQRALELIKKGVLRYPAGMKGRMRAKRK